MQKHGKFGNYGKSVAGVEGQGSRGGGHDKGCEVDVKTFWDQVRKALWIRFYLTGKDRWISNKE